MQGELKLSSSSDEEQFINGLIPNDHLLKKIDAIVDFNFIHEPTASFYYLNNGRPSIAPELYF